MKAQKRTYVIVEVTKTLKQRLISAARRDRRSLSDWLRPELERLVRNGLNSGSADPSPSV